MSIELGYYRHYKGQLYLLLNVATHSETLEQLAVYQPQYGEKAWWVRPLAMFCETVLVDGEPVARFSYLGPDFVPTHSAID